MTKLQDALAKQEAWLAALRTLNPADVREMCAPLFDEFPAVHAVRWKQVLGGLDANGESCYFDIDEVQLKRVEDVEFVDWYDVGAELFDEVESYIRSELDYDILEAVFGVPVQVSVTRDSIEACPVE